MLETIVAAAINYDGMIVSVQAPGRHHNVIRVYNDHTDRITRGDHEQGFITSLGRFVGRPEALQIATAAGQAFREDGPQIRNGGIYLFSEDLW